MRATRLFVPLFLMVAWAFAQVLPPEEILDANMRELQKKYVGELKQISVAFFQHELPYRFYFSRTLDLSETAQHASDQRAIQFDRYRDQTVLKITGNYFASYSAELMTPEERARQTYQDVMLPLLEAAVPVFASSSVPEAFAFEISHHVRRKVLGVSSENVENVVLILPRASAVRLMTATNAQARQAAVLEGQAFLNAAPIELWPRSGSQISRVARAKEPIERLNAAPLNASAGSSSLPNVRAAASIAPASIVPATAEKTAKSSVAVAASERDTSPDALKKVQNSYQAVLDRMVQELNTQAHFVRYAPPAFIPFHSGLYLQIAVTTSLPQSAAGSQYEVAALAFDQHIAHLIRPALEYFKEDRGDIDGIDFSTSVRVGADDSRGSPVAAEFIFPLNMLRLYKQFDCTGQQLIDSAFVLINGERVGLDLQIAEAGVPLK